jgi:death-on-curing protein
VTIVWVELTAVLAAHDDQLAANGGLPGFANEGALHGALERPKNTAFYSGVDDVVALAATYLVGIAKAHAFSDANKRTAWVTARSFLRANGVELAYTPADALAMVVGAADSTYDIDDVAAWMRARRTKR